VIDLLRGDGVTVIETTLSYADFQDADEIFSTGNFAKIAPSSASTAGSSRSAHSMRERESSTGILRTP
jgi:branched-subunit amino acid aminotransferase/4-amino-4-deoxychorismate lyase